MIRCPAGTCPAELAGLSCPGEARPGVDTYCKLALGGHGERVVVEARRLAATSTALAPPLPAIHRPLPELVPLAESRAVARCPERRKLACACEGRWACSLDGLEKDIVACLDCVRSRPPETAP